MKSVEIWSSAKGHRVGKYGLYAFVVNNLQEEVQFYIHHNLLC